MSWPVILWIFFGCLLEMNILGYMCFWRKLFYYCYGSFEILAQVSYIPIDKLTKHANGEEELIIPSIFCHNVNIERQVKAMTNVTKNPRAITHADQQALLLATEQSINKVGTNATKKDFLKK